MLISGFPRNVEQIHRFEKKVIMLLIWTLKYLRKVSKLLISVMIFLFIFYNCEKIGVRPVLVLIDCSEIKLRKNLSRRRKVGSYNPKAYKQRLKIYRRQTLPMLKYLDKKNRLRIVSLRRKKEYHSHFNQTIILCRPFHILLKSKTSFLG